MTADVAFKRLAEALARLEQTETEHLPATASDHGFNSWRLEVARRNRVVVDAARDYLRATAGVAP